MNGDTIERLSQEGQCQDAKEHGLLARASAFARGVLGSIQALAGTTACKGVRIARLKDKIQQEIIKVLGNLCAKDSLLRLIFTYSASFDIFSKSVTLPLASKTKRNTEISPLFTFDVHPPIVGTCPVLFVNC